MPRKDEAEPINVPHNGRTCFGIPGDGDTNQIAIADDAVGGIEIDPARARQVSLHPRVRCASADVVPLGSLPGTKIYPLTKRAAKPRERIASIMRTAKSRQLPRRLCSVSLGLCTPFSSAARVEEVLPDAERHGAKQAHGPGGPGWIQKLASPNA